MASPAELDWGAIGTNAGIFFASASALWLGIKQGVKKLSKGDLEPTTEKKDTRIAGAMLVETTSMLMWSESNRNVAEAVKDLTDEVIELRREVARNTEETRIAAAVRARG